MMQYRYDAIGESVWKDHLPNGLDIYVVKKPEYGKKFAFLAVRCGSTNLKSLTEDGEWKRFPVGTAHYLEHKLFETEDGSASDMFAENGAEDNAFTAADMTGYYFECTCKFEENLRLLLSLVANPHFTDESVQQERGIITQEICMEDDEPYSLLYYRVMEMLYSEHTIRERIAGTEESIAEISADVLYRFYKAFYGPGNMVLCIAGNVEPEAVREIVNEVMAGDRLELQRAECDYGESAQAECEYEEWTMPISVPIFGLGVKCDPAKRGECLKQRFAAELACDALFGPSSALYNRLYDEGLINGTFGGDYEFVPGAAYLLITGESRDPIRVREEILKEAKRLVKCGIDEALWGRLTRAAYGAMIRGLNSLENICIELAQTHFDGEDYLRFPEIFQSIEKRDVEELLGRWCVPERTALAVVKPQK